jgi:hypothetical protein
LSIQGPPRTVFIWTVLIAVFCVVTTAVTFTGLLQQFGRLAACPGAQSFAFEESSGGSVDPAGAQGPVSTTVTELRCTFPDGSTRTIDNDQLFLYGLGTAAAIGALLGLALGGFNLVRSR